MNWVAWFAGVVLLLVAVLFELDLKELRRARQRRDEISRRQQLRLQMRPPSFAVWDGDVVRAERVGQPVKAISSRVILRHAGFQSGLVVRNSTKQSDPRFSRKMAVWVLPPSEK